MQNARTWSATWAQHPEGTTTRGDVFLYRSTLILEKVPKRFVVHVSADQRYRLYVNGASVAWGPSRGDLIHWRYETVDIAPHLKPGANVLAARVHFFPDPMAPMAQVTSGRSGFLVQGDTDAESAANTPKGWKVWRDDAYSFSTDEAATLRAYCVVGPSETVDAARHPWGWEGPDFDASAWPDARGAGRAFSHGAQDAGSFWWLTPRELPMMEETPQPLGKVVRAEGIPAPQEGAAITVPANTKAVLLIDRGFETCAFPEVTVRGGGGGARVRLAYAEALRDKETGQKGDRNDITGKVLHGYSDTWLLDGGGPRLLTPLWWRTYRYAELAVETKGEPVTVESLRGVYTGYPFETRAKFDAPEQPEMAELIEIGWRTLRLCAHETFMDCPYYEQLQYAGDTRIQCLVSLYTSGDPKLFRAALAHLDDSRLAMGLTQSRFPSRLPQMIPPFSLWWVCMAHDYWRHVPGDDDFLRGLLPGIRGVLQWFGDRVRPSDGLMGPLEWWGFADWCDEWPGGVPPGAKQGGSALMTLQYALALEAAGELHAHFGLGQEAQRLHRARRKALDAVKRHCYDEKSSRVADTPEKKTFSQHTAALAALASGMLTAPQRRALVERTLSDATLTQATFYFRFYVHRAMAAAGLGDRYLEMLAPWHEMKCIGLTTWAEKPEPTRSDCHAWSASPNYELLATMLGVTPGGPGWETVRIAPHFGPLTRLSGSVPHPKGDVVVSLEKQPDGKLSADVTLPEGVKGSLTWGKRSVPLTGGAQRLTV
ncbi:MAG TPA: alpha-L-rhamnosidase C-terminal domain-containing protein [Armatimonadaceae bacterium]|nr:alpha-L-rhamnosidase C-terminal domain-containing protein [Armatimonadaceae bacterium]